MKVSSTTIRNHLDCLEQTFVIAKVSPFVGNKRTEITSNPIYYFIDNGFRNIALRNFTNLSSRSDAGLLVEGFIFQEIHKFRAQHYLDFDIHFWRTKSGAEVDFVLFKNRDQFIPIEVKFQSFKKPTVTRSFHSFIEAYKPTRGIIITKDFLGDININGCHIHFIPILQLDKFFSLVKQAIG